MALDGGFNVFSVIGAKLAGIVGAGAGPSRSITSSG